MLARYSGCGLDEVCGLVPPVPHYTPCPSPKAARGLGIGVAIVAKASSPTTLLPFPIRSQPISSPYTIPRAHWHLSNTSKLLARRVIPLPRLARADVPTTSMFVAVPQRQRTHALLLQLPHVKSRGFLWLRCSLLHSSHGFDIARAPLCHNLHISCRVSMSH